MNSLDGRVALVVGASTGIGAATARLLAKEGARVALAGIHREANEQLAATIVEAGGQAIGIGVDVRRSPDVQAAVQRVQDTFGALHIMYVNAGVASLARAHELDETEWNNVIAVNLTGSFLCAKYALPAIMASGGGSIVLASSSSGVIGDYAAPAYCASKGGLIMLTRQMALDYARDGIRVNCVCPGWIDTAFNEPFIALNPDEHAQTIDRMVPLGRQGSADEVARAVLFLVSEQSTYMTGHALVLDGGLTIW